MQINACDLLRAILARNKKMVLQIPQLQNHQLAPPYEVRFSLPFFLLTGEKFFIGFLSHSAITLVIVLLTMIKKITQTAVINIVFQRIFIKLDVSYASQHTFSKVTVTIFKNYIYIYISYRVWNLD